MHSQRLTLFGKNHHGDTRVVLATVISIAQNFQQGRAPYFHMLSPSFRTIIHRLRIIKSCTWSLGREQLNSQPGVWLMNQLIIHELHTLVSLSVVISCNFIFHKLTSDWGKWKLLNCRNRSTETEVQKPMCGSGKKSCLSVFSALLTYDCVC